MGTVAIFVYVGVEVGIPNFINLFLTTSPDAAGAKGFGMDTAMAGSIVGTYWFLMMIGRLCGGALGAKFSSKTQLTVVSSTGFDLLADRYVCPQRNNSSYACI